MAEITVSTDQDVTVAQSYCCDDMKENVEYRCETHPDPFECPTSVMFYERRFDEYGLVIHDGSGDFVIIQYCPWCGARLPASKRDRYFKELERMGIDPWSEDVPEIYQSDAWWSGRRAFDA